MEASQFASRMERVYRRVESLAPQHGYPGGIGSDMLRTVSVYQQAGSSVSLLHFVCVRLGCDSKTAAVILGSLEDWVKQVTGVPMEGLVPVSAPTPQGGLQDAHVVEAMRLVQSRTLKPASALSTLAEAVYKGLAGLSPAGASVSGLMRATGVDKPDLLETGLRSLLWACLRVTLHPDGSIGPARRTAASGSVTRTGKRVVSKTARVDSDKELLGSLTSQQWRSVVSRLSDKQVRALAEIAQQGVGLPNEKG